MDNILVTQLINESLANVNVSVVVTLMAIGFLIKHIKFLDKVNNDVIPPVLLLFSVVFLAFTDGFNVQTIISAIINTAVAVGLHQQGKNIFTVTVVPSISKLLDGFISKDEEPEKTDDELVDEIVDEVLSEDEEVENEDTDM